MSTPDRAAFEAWYASDLRAHKYPILDNECAWYVWAACSRAIAAQAIEHKRHKTLVLAAFDQQERQAKRPLIDKRAEIERNARETL